MDFLVIDDNKTFRDATACLIDSEGHYAETASSGALGLVRLKEEKFDAVLLDLLLGSENGLDILHQILKYRPSLPVIIFTAQGSIASAVEAMRRGAVDFLEKPFTREQFHLVLARVLRFIDALRASGTCSSSSGNGWLRGLADAEIGAALALMHERPEYRWTVAGIT